MLRISKTDEEIDKIIHAQRCAEDALKKIIKNLKPGKTERQISDEIEMAALNYSEGFEVKISIRPIVSSEQTAPSPSPEY